MIAGLGIGAAVGFGLYFLPILTAGPGLDQAAVQALATSAEWRGRSVCDLLGSEFLGCIFASFVRFTGLLEWASIRMGVR